MKETVKLLRGQLEYQNRVTYDSFYYEFLFQGGFIFVKPSLS